MIKASKIGVVSVALLLLTVFTMPPSSRAQAAPSSLSVDYHVSLGQHYSIYGSVKQGVSLQLSGYANTQNSVRFSVTFLFVLRNVTLPKAYWNVVQISQHPVVTLLNATIPGPVSRFNFTVTGFFADQSFLYRNSASIPVAFVHTNDSQISGPSSYTIEVKLTPQTQVLSTFPVASATFPVQTATVAGGTLLVANFPTVRGEVPNAGWIYFVILYEPPLYNFFLIVYVAAILFAIVTWKWLIGRGVGLVVSRAPRTLSSVRRAIEAFEYRKLLALLVAVSMLMILLALIFGPSPTPRVYLAATPSTSIALASTVRASGYSTLTPANASDEFNTLSNLGVFHSIVIADYPPPIYSQGLQSSYRIIVMGNYVPPKYVAGLKEFYPGHVNVANNTAQLSQYLLGQRLGYAGNHLGLGFSQLAYNAVVPFEAVLSLTVPFLSLAFLSRYLIEEGKTTLWKLAFVIPASIFVFLYAEFIFLQTDVLLGIPVALHTALSPAETAGGAIGIGGGSKPRLVMGALGFLFGIASGKGGTLKLDKWGLLVFLGGLAFLVTDPLTGGQAFYNLLLVGLTPDKGTAVGVYAWLGVRGFLGQFMNLFGNYLTLTYFSQHGAVVFYIGAVPFVLYTAIRKTTATILALFSALCAGIGFVRIGDQIPQKAIASAMPGITVGLLFLGAFLTLALTETYIRKRIGGA